MTIYGVALLAICTLVGVFIGDLLGSLLGVKSNVGGVGIAMMLLIGARLLLTRKGDPKPAVPVAKGPHGLPLAVQLIGLPGADGRLLQVGQWASEMLEKS